VKGLITMVGGTLGGGLGWWLGALEGTMTAFFISVLGTALGVYISRRLIDEYLP